jgi:toxin YoeB
VDRVKLDFSDPFWQEYQYWVSTNDKIHKRINELIKQCRRTPFKGTGKPEPLKGDLTGWWSRRISQEDRMVYRVSGTGDNQSLEIAQLRFHY